MSDSPLEELEAHEHAEHAEHAARENDPLISQVTFTIAVLAVVAAIGASLETTEGDRAIISKNDAVLEQNKASDTWNLYQAKSLKKNLYAIAADQPGPKAEGYAKVAAKNGADQTAIFKQAKAFEASRDARSAQAEVHEIRHGRLTIASTLLHMSIAIATLAIILRRRWPWFAALALTAAGAIIAIWAYL
ncbi:MAG TPA: DUF4337 family protein [Caulobacteraceae bacterium]